MLILNNEEIDSLPSVDIALRSLEKAYTEQAAGKAVNRPRTDLYLPGKREGSVYALMIGTSFLGISRRELEFTRDDRLPARFGEPKEPGREDRLTRIPKLEGTISGNMVSNRERPEPGPMIRLDICPAIAVRDFSISWLSLDLPRDGEFIEP